MVATCGIIRKRHLCCCCVCGFIFGCAATIGGIVGIVWYFQNSVSNHLKKITTSKQSVCIDIPSYTNLNMDLYENTTEYKFDDPCYENGDTLKEKQKLRFVDNHENDTKTASVFTRYKFTGNVYDTEENLKIERAARTYHCCCCFLGFTVGCVFATGVCVSIYYFLLPYLVPLSIGTPMGCLEGWQRYKGNCYFFSIFNLSWTDAQMNCTNMLSHLTDVDDLEEALYFASLTELFISGDAWIGGRGTNSSNFKWLTGEHDSIPKVMNFTYWAQNKPSSSTIEKQFNSPPSMQNCVHVWKQENYKWNNNFCTKEKQFICKQNKT